MSLCWRENLGAPPWMQGNELLFFPLAHWTSESQILLVQREISFFQEVALEKS